MQFIRSISQAAKGKLKCGLEIHCQLKTSKKLFSYSEHCFNELPNSRVSYFDAGLPGTQPHLNPEVVLLAVITGVAFGSKINLSSSFDRKHYFYGDQPLGYQITQRYSPICLGGKVQLNKKFDDVESKTITLDQIQIEQDTGKSIYVDERSSLVGGGCTKIDLNRANVPLLEIVTNPDFGSIAEVRAFVRKVQSILKHLDVTTGELETGAMRVDVNVSVDGGPRVEIKNLSSTSAISGAIAYEHGRQKTVLEAGGTIYQETRGWDGKQTVRSRTKESGVDYRYMPDPELPVVVLTEELIRKVLSVHVTEFPEDILNRLVATPYNLRVKDAKLLVSDAYPGLLEYYYTVFESTATKHGLASKVPSNLILHELLGQLTKHQLQFQPSIVTAEQLVELLVAIHVDRKITNSSGKLLLQYLVGNPHQTQTIGGLIREFELEVPEMDDAEIAGICREIVERHSDIAENLKNGRKLNSLQYLVGQAMRETQGKIKAATFEASFKKLLNIPSSGD